MDRQMNWLAEMTGSSRQKDSWQCGFCLVAEAEQWLSSVTGSRSAEEEWGPLDRAADWWHDEEAY